MCTLIVVMTANRGLVRRLQFEHHPLGPRSNDPRAARISGKTVKVLAVGRKGRDNYAPRLQRPDRGRQLHRVRPQDVLRSVEAEEVANKITEMYARTVEFDVCNHDLLALQVGGLTQTPLRKPANRAVPVPQAETGWRTWPLRYDYEPSDNEILGRPVAAQPGDPSCSVRHAGEMPPRSTARK